jgi:putative ABC transport system permease protein
MRRVAIKGLLERPLRTALTALAIVLGVALVTAALVISDTQRRGAEALSSAAYDGTAAAVTTKTAFKLSDEGWGAAPTIDAAVLDRVRSVPGVTAAAGDITDMDSRIIGPDGKPLGDGPYFGVGLDSRTPGVEALTPFRLRDGAWATGPGQAVIDAKTAEDAGYAIGDRVTVATRGKARAFTVTGIATFGPVESLGTASAVVFDLAEAQRLYGKRGEFDAILAAGAGDHGALREAIAAATGPRTTVQPAAEQDRFTLSGLEMFIDILRIVLMAFGFVAVFVGGFTIVNTLSITVAQRTREFGLLRMIGASRAQVRRSVLLEALVIGFGASVAGIAAGYGLARGLDGVFASLGLDLPEAGTVFAGRTVLVALAVGTLSTVVAGFVPARRATRVAPVAALREGAEGDHAPGLVARAVRAAVSVVGRPAERLGGAAGRLARRNAMRAPGRTGATAAALVIGVALTTLVTVVAQGLKDSVSGQVESRVAATHVVVGEDGWSPVDPGIELDLARAPGVQTVSSIRQDAALAFGDEESVNAVDPATVGRVFDFEWAQGDAGTFAQLGRDGAIVDSGWAAEHGLAVGDRFEITSATGAQLGLIVRGIEESPIVDAFGFGPITISRAAFDEAFVVDRNRFTFVQTEAGARLGPALAPYPDAKIQSKAAYIDEQVRAIDPLLAILWVLLGLSVIVSLFGIVNALVLATFERTRELGTLRALGMSRRQMRRMVRHESIITALLGAVTGIAVGLALAGIVTGVFSEEGLAFAVPLGALIAFTVVAVGAGVLAAVLPARRAARLDPLQALAYE